MYKKGDWFYHEFELYEALEDSNANGRFDIHNGFIETVASESECVPLTVRNKVISESFKSIYNKLREINNNGLNYPDIHRHFEEKWLECCKEQNNDKIQEVYKQLERFVQDIKDRCGNFMIDGVSILRK